MARKKPDSEHDMKERFYTEVQPNKKKRKEIMKPLTEELKKKLQKEMEDCRKQ
jgi:hypothetical protein